MYVCMYVCKYVCMYVCMTCALKTGWSRTRNKRVCSIVVDHKKTKKNEKNKRKPKELPEETQRTRSDAGHCWAGHSFELSVMLIKNICDQSVVLVVWAIV